jgi:low affinity Fe/Cu permease
LQYGGKTNSEEHRRGAPLLPEMNTFGSFARVVNRFVASPAATFAAFLVVVAWALSGPAFHFSDAWQLVINTGTSIVTFLMVFVLNNAQSRDTSAMNAKLDSLILAVEAADNRLIGLESKPDADARLLTSELLDRASDAMDHALYADS